MADEPTSDVQAFAKLLALEPASGGGRGRHSPLYWWMFTRADELRPILERTRTAWANVAAKLPDTDETKDGTGRRPSGERVRKVWFEVRKAKGWTVDLPAARPSAATKHNDPVPVAPPPQPPEPQVAVPADADSDNYKEITVTASDGKTTKTVRIPKR